MLKNLFKKNEKNEQVVDMSEVNDNLIVIDNVELYGSVGSNLGKLIFTTHDVEFISKNETNESNFRHIFSRDKMIVYSKTQYIDQYLYTVDEITFTRNAQNSVFLFNNVCDMLKRRNVIIENNMKKRENLNYYDDIEKYTFEKLTIGYVSRMLEDKIYYGSVIFNGYNIVFDARLDSGEYVKEEAHIRKFVKINCTIKHESKYSIAYINDYLFFIHGDRKDILDKWDKIENHYNYVNEVMNHRNEILIEEVDKLVLMFKEEYKSIFINFIVKSNYKYYLDITKLLSLEYEINSRGCFVPFDYYSLEINSDVSDEWNALNSNDYELKSFHSDHFVKLLQIISSKLNLFSPYKDKLFVLKMLRETTIEYFANEFINESSHSIIELTNIDNIINEYFQIYEDSSMEIENVGKLTYYLISKNFISNNFILSAHEINGKLNELMETNKLKHYENQLMSSQTTKNIITIDDVDLMNGHEFEHFISSVFSKMGYLTEVTRGSGDQGIDVIAEKNGIKIGIQAKCYSGNVSNSAIQEVVAGLTHYKLDKAMVITNSNFTQSARDLAQSNGVVLWDRAILKEKIDTYSVEN